MAKLMKKIIVGDLIFLFLTHVIITNKFPPMPMKKVNVCVMTIGRKALNKIKLQLVNFQKTILKLPNALF